MMSLGSASLSEVLNKRGVFWLCVYIAGGAVAGGVMAGTGLPWYLAGAIVLAVLFSIHCLTSYFNKRRQARRGY